MQKKIFLATLLIGLLGSVAFVSTGQASAQLTNPFQNIPLSGTTSEGTFEGRFFIRGFVESDGQLFARGRVSGTFTEGNGTVSQINSSRVLVSVTGASAMCRSLHLDFGVLKFPNSDRQIQLDGAIMNLIALRSPGTVLCDVTQLIQPGVPLTTLTTRLNLLIRVFSY